MKTKAEATTTPVEIASGDELYKEHCAKCHKEDGTGGKVDILGKTLKGRKFDNRKNG